MYWVAVFNRIRGLQFRLKNKAHAFKLVNSGSAFYASVVLSGYKDKWFYCKFFINVDTE